MSIVRSAILRVARLAPRYIGPPLLKSGLFQQFIAVAEITAGLTAAPYALAFAEPPRLKLARTKHCTSIVEGEMTTPDPQCPASFLCCTLHFRPLVCGFLALMLSIHRPVASSTHCLSASLCNTLTTCNISKRSRTRMEVVATTTGVGGSALISRVTQALPASRITCRLPCLAISCRRLCSSLNSSPVKVAKMLIYKHM